MAEGGEKRSKTAHRTPGQIKRHGRTYQASAKQKANRAARGRARTAMKKKVGAKALRGKDVGHKRALSKGGSNKLGNLKVTTRKKNRGHGMTRGSKPNKGR